MGLWSWQKFDHIPTAMTQFSKIKFFNEKFLLILCKFSWKIFWKFVSKNFFWNFFRKQIFENFLGKICLKNFFSTKMFWNFFENFWKFLKIIENFRKFLKNFWKISKILKILKIFWKKYFWYFFSSKSNFLKSFCHSWHCSDVIRPWSSDS